MQSINTDRTERLPEDPDPVPRLHFPQAPARPGDAPDFSYLSLSPAGAAPRPEVLAHFSETRPLTEQLIRVLDEDGRAVGPWNPRLESSVSSAGLRAMLLTRLFDERMHRSHRQGKISFYVRSLGEEAVSVAACMALRAGDMLFPAYRNQGLFVTRGRPLVDLMCQLLGNTRDMCKGRQLPVFYQWGAGRIFSLSGNLTTQFPQAVGWSMASALKGQSDIAASWTGDGSASEGDFHEALVFATVYRAPVILNVVNNQWAISTSQGFAGVEQQSLAARGPAYGIAGLRVDGNDFLAVYAATRWAAARARNSGGPTLIELVTYRAAAHSTSDDPGRYRPRDDSAAWPLGDPIERLKSHMIGLGEWSDTQHTALTQELESEVTRSWAEAVQYGTLNEGPRLDNDLMFEDVFETLPDNLRRQCAELRAEQEEQPCPR
jgi:2-oxoisovalerate dehydrogenase E1 component alpha subunit